MSKFKILNFGRDAFIEAERMEVQPNGQIFFYNKGTVTVEVPTHAGITSYEREGWELIAVFPQETAIVKVVPKKREFDFVNQREQLEKRNEHLGKETPGFVNPDMNDEKIPRGKYNTEKRRIEALENSYTPAEKELYDGEVKQQEVKNEDGRANWSKERKEQHRQAMNEYWNGKRKLNQNQKEPNYRPEHQSKELEAAHSTIIQTGTDKQLENAEERAINQINDNDEWVLE